MDKKTAFSILGDQRRRTVLKQMAALTAFAGSGFGGALAAMAGPTAQAKAGQGYRALVCLFQYGGNDHANMFVPLDAERHKTYASYRENLTIDRATVHALKPQRGSDAELGLHPSLPRLAALFNQGEAAAVMNVGPLVVPTSKKDWDEKRVPLPLQLFSHSDQQRAWFAAAPDTLTDTGWLGRLADMIEPQFNGGSPVSSIVTTAGQELILQGHTARSFSLSRNGAPQIMARKSLYGFRQNAAALEKLMTSSHHNLFADVIGQQNRRALVAGDIYREAVTTAGLDISGIPGTRLGRQLANVAQAVAAAQGLGQSRQIFFVGRGGWDFHSNILERQEDLLSEMDTALDAFRQVMVQAGLWDKVTVFTTGDFGRALIGNGRGTDHGWGGHHMVMGGTVAGGHYCGTMPEIGIDTPEDAGQGRLIPSLSMSQYAAELIRWLGATPDVIETALPNIKTFDRTPIGLFH